MFYKCFNEIECDLVRFIQLRSSLQINIECNNFVKHKRLSFFCRSDSDFCRIFQHFFFLRIFFQQIEQFKCNQSSGNPCVAPVLRLIIENCRCRNLGEILELVSHWMCERWVGCAQVRCDRVFRERIAVDRSTPQTPNAIQRHATTAFASIGNKFMKLFCGQKWVTIFFERKKRQQLFMFGKIL